MPPAAVEDLNIALGALPELAARLALISATVPGRITFSTSLGMKDQAVLHAIAQSKAAIDVRRAHEVAILFGAAGVAVSLKI